MNHVFVAVALALPLCNGFAVAQQQTLLFSLEREERSLAGNLLEGGLFRPDEVAAVTPRTSAPYAASVFLSMAAQWAYIGDADNSFYLVNFGLDGPGYDTDAILVKRFRSPNAYGPRDVFVSKLYDGSGLNSGVKNGSVFRYSQQGGVEYFVTEQALLGAIGQAPNSDLNVDAICQDSAGNLFVSFWDAESVNGTNLHQGGILYVPVSAITYDFRGNVTLITNGAAVIAAQDTDVNTWVQASGVRSSNRTVPPTIFNLTALEIDPRGGTWVSPQNASLTLPNLIFAWQGYSNDGAIVSTRSGGSIAKINNVDMGSAVETSGSHLGIAPLSDGTNGVYGLGLIPARQRPVLAVENYPTNLVNSSTTLWQRQELSGATPGGVVLFFVDFSAGGQFPSTTLPGFNGELFGIGLIINLGVTTADSGGFATNTFQWPVNAIGTNTPICVQAFDAGTFSFATPAALQFQ